MNRIGAARAGVLAVLVVGLLSHGLGLEPVNLVSNAWQVVSYLAATLCLWWTVRQFEPGEAGRRPWQLLAWGQAFATAGFFIYGFIEVALGVADPFPSLADAFWLAAYVPNVWAALVARRLLLNSGLGLKPEPLPWLPGILVSLPMIVLVVWPTLQGEGALFERVLAAAYPLGDLLLFATALTVARVFSQFGRGSLGWPWRLLALGFILEAAADTAYVLLEAMGTYETGMATDALWPISTVFKAWGALAQVTLMSDDSRSQTKPAA